MCVNTNYSDLYSSSAEVYRAQSEFHSKLQEKTQMISIGDIVYIRARVTHVGDCGQLGVAIQQPGNKALIAPEKKEVFKKVVREELVSLFPREKEK